MARFVGSSTPLLANAVWSDILLPMGADRVTGSVFSDQAGVLVVEQSGDLDWNSATPGASAHWDVQGTPVNLVANTPQKIDEVVLLPFVRVRYTNGGTNQGVFRIRAQVQSAGGK